MNSTMPINTGSAFDGGDIAAMRRQQPDKLAKQFEGLFVSMLVKEMRQSSEPGAGLFPGDNSDTYGGMFDMYLGEHIAENGGIGLADSIASSIRTQTT